MPRFYTADTVDASYALMNGETPMYALVGSEYVPLTSLPATYFVRIDGEENAAGYVAANYFDINGYVRAAAVERVDYEPVTKYATKHKLSVHNDGYAVNLRAQPSHLESNVLLSIPSGSELYYYGTVDGTAQVEAVGNKWYYVRYSGAGNEVRGYVYSLYCTAETIPTNVIEKVEVVLPDPPADLPVDGDEPLPDDDQVTDDGGFSPTRNQEIILVSAMCLAMIILMYLLFRPPGKHDRETN